MTSRFGTGSFYTQTFGAHSDQSLLEGEPGDMLCNQGLGCDVTKFVTGVAQLNEFPLGGSPIMQVSPCGFSSCILIVHSL